MQLEEVDFNINVRHLGELNKDKIIYHIKAGDNTLGFFAMYRFMLESLYFADVCGMVPVVEYSSESPYAEKSMINGTLNPYEYYFCQPADITVEQAKSSANVANSIFAHNLMIQMVFNGRIGLNDNTYETTELYLKELARVQKKYIRLNTATSVYVNQGIDAVIGKEKVLGVHVRGSDFKKNYHNHPIYISELDYIIEIEKIIEEEHWDKIFLATDDVQTLEIFKQRFGKSLVYYDDVIRSDSETSVAFSKAGREAHNFKLGLEVIRDVYTLAACEGLVAGVSKVSSCARIIRMSQSGDYRTTKIISKGINQNSKRFIALQESKGHLDKDTDESAKMKSMADKHLALFLLMNQWVRIKQEGKSLLSYFRSNGYAKIAIYGMSYVGETLVNELRGSGIEIAYGIDKGSGSCKCNIDVFTPADDLENVDAVVVTAITFFEDIKEELQKKITCPIISLQDVIYEL